MSLSRKCFFTLRETRRRLFSSYAISHDEFTQSKEKKKRDREKADADDDLKDKILDASLKFVPKLGWTKKALRAGTESLGFPAVTSGIIANGPLDLIHHHQVLSNLKLEELMLQQREAAKLPPNPNEFLRRNVETRLRMNIPYMSRWAEAIALMTSEAPRESLIIGLELMDSLWHYAGDKSVDGSWYTKRIALGIIYKATELTMLQDKTEDYRETWQFLDRRFQDQKDFMNQIPGPNDIIGIASTIRNIIGLPR